MELPVGVAVGVSVGVSVSVAVAVPVEVAVRVGVGVAVGGARTTIEPFMPRPGTAKPSASLKTTVSITSGYIPAAAFAPMST